MAVAASLKPFFAPASVAVIGASPRRGTIGGELFRNILAADFTGSVYPVNRAGDPVGGVAGYATVAELPVTVDLAVICVPGGAVLDAARDVLASGVKALCVISAGFAETGAEGAARQDELLALVRAHGARLVGPNCLGIASTATRLNATFARRSLPAGRIAFSSQSGALGLALLEEADARGLGLSSFVSIGNKADVSSNDLLEYWEEDDESDVILLYLESFGNPQKFARVAGRVARSKPILALRSGTSRAGARAASSHTAALAGSDKAVDALFWQAGVLRAADAGGAARRGGALLHAAAATRQPRRGRDQCRRPRHPLRRRVRRCRARAAPARPTRRSSRSQQALPAEASTREPGRPARLGDRRDVRGRACRRCSPTRGSTR